jgi:hypothetical protein
MCFIGLLLLNCSQGSKVTKLYAKYNEIEKAATSSTITIIAKSFTGGYMGYSVSDKIDKGDIEDCLVSRKEQQNILSELTSLISEPVVVPSNDQESSVKLSPTYIDSLINVNEQRIDELTKLLNWYILTQNEE